MITKVIKLHQDTYDKLEAIRDKRETFDNVVRRLLMLHEQLSTVSNILGPSHVLRGPVPPGKES